MTIDQQPPLPAALQDTKSRRLLSSPAARLLTVALLFAAALLPRLLGLGEATTEDEDQWMMRTGNFARALGAGEWRGTFQIGHPGATTMWLADLALGRERAQRFANGMRGERLVTQVEDFVPALHAARLPFAVLNAALVVGCGLLAARLFGRGPGLLAGLLLALDPYWSAMSPIVGMDGLLAGLSGCSLLCAMLGFGATGRGGRPVSTPGPGVAEYRPARVARGTVMPGLGWVVLSGALAGLSILTKAPGLFVLPLVALLAALEVRRGGLDVWRITALKLGLFGLGLLGAGLIWPAFWADPIGTAQRMLAFARDTSAEPHAQGNNYFAGRLTAEPGPWFYPVALALRLGPAVALGLLLLPALSVPRRWLEPMAVLVAAVALFGLALTLSPKKVDRYILPLFPALAILAAVAWWTAIRLTIRRLGGRSPAPVIAALALVAALQVWPFVGAAPHLLSAYNPLVGGQRAALWAVPVGWGEGLDTVGAYLQSQPNADQLVVAIWYPLYVNFQAHSPGRVVNIAFSRPGQVANQQLLDQADFYVDYLHARQRGLTPDFLAGRQPDLVVTINGFEYARVYRLKP